MAHKTITISTSAYEALARLKRERESFTDAILRLTKKKREGNLLEYIRSMEKDDELSKNIEEVAKRRKSTALRKVEL